MRIRVERLRIWLLASAVFLVLVIAAFIGSARYIRHHFLADLPAKLGANVKIDSTGVTWSHVDQGRTIYTIHAAKDIEHTDGKVALHDVWIKLYGRKQDRADMIRGDDWEWDQKAGVVRAIGVVHIDLQNGAAAGASGSAGNTAKRGTGAAAARVLHVTTSDLVYMDKLGVAATSAPIEFESGAMKGHAVGADYSSDSGVLMLHSAVSMSGASGGRPVEVNASAAELDDQDHVVLLTHARLSSQGRTAEAEQATLHLRADQTLERVEAQGKVTVEENGATVTAGRGDVTLNAASHAQKALLTGGVRYSADGPLRQLHGEAQQAAIDFDGRANPQPQHAVFTGAVHIVERTRAAIAAREGAQVPWSTRELTAAKVEAALAPAEPGASKAELRDVEASGDAHFTAVNNGSLADARGAGAGTGTTELSADDLKAHLLATGDTKQPPQLDTLAGRGHTLVRQLSTDGVEQTSAGDTLDAKFLPAGAGGAGKTHVAGGAVVSAAQMGVQTIASAVQQGHVLVTRNATAKRAASSGTKNARQGDGIERATAQQAAYDGALDRVTLTGGVQLTQAASELWASQLTLDHATGDAHAVGAVKVDYLQSDAPQTGQRAGVQSRGAKGNAEPTHILADSADMDHATEVATFYGKPVRLWQGGSQVQAPVIELARAQKRLIARGDAATGWSGATQPAQVHTVLMNSAGDRGSAGKQDPAQTACATTTAAKPAASARPQQQAVRIASGGLVYSGILGQADFTGGIRAETAGSTIRANQGIVYLDSATDAGGGPAATPSLAGNPDHMVVSGKVVIDAPGLHATGERLLYTADDQVFLLTGDSKNPPRAVDIRGNTTTGAALRFHHACEAAGGDTVEALGALPNQPAERVHTESRVGGNPRKEKEVR